MEFISHLLAGNSDWLLNRLLHYAAQKGFSRLTSGEKSAWKQAVSLLNSVLVEAAKLPEDALELHADEHYGSDPISSFAIHSAARHRERGINLSLFVAFLKYTRRAYLDLLDEVELTKDRRLRARRLFNLAFDRMETAICDEWSRLSESQQHEELRKANQELVEEKTSFLALLESLVHPVLLLSENGDIRYMNSSALAMAEAISASAGLEDAGYAGTDWPPLRLGGKEPHEAGPCCSLPATFPWLHTELKACTLGKKRRHVFQQELNLDGSREHYEVSISCMENVHGKTLGYVASCANMTRLSRIEAFLGDRLAFIQTMMESIPVAFFYKDAKGRFQGCNRAFEEMHGHSRSQIIGKTITDILPGPMGEELAKTDRQLLETPGVVTYEVTGFMQSDPSREFLAVKSTYTGADGNLAGLVGTYTDITERKASEKLAHETADLLQVILKGIRTGYILLDVEEFKVVEVNSIAEEITGYDRPELTGGGLELIGLSSREFADYMTSIGCQELTPGTKCMEWGRNVLEVEGRLTRKDGEIIPVTRSFLTVTHRGKPHLAIIFFDISQRKSLEQQLTYAQKLESIGQLAAGIAHEINTPMQYIGDNISFLGNAFQQFLDLLDDVQKAGAVATAPDGSTLGTDAWLPPLLEKANFDFLQEELPDAISQTKEGVAHVTKIVQGIKKFSHPDVEEQRQYDLNAAVENTIVVARNEWKYVAEVETDLDPDLPSITCFPGDVNQVLLNLLVNAAHAIGEKSNCTDKGTIHITTKLAGNRAELRVRDSGTGIPQHVQDKIFNPFFTTKEVGKGTGQGLAITHSVVVNRHGGSITFETAPGKGTVFIVRLPVAGKADQSKEAAA